MIVYTPVIEIDPIILIIVFLNADCMRECCYQQEKTENRNKGVKNDKNMKKRKKWLRYSIQVSKWIWEWI